MRSVAWAIGAFSALFVALLAAQVLPVGAAEKAARLCEGVFVSGRSIEEITSVDFAKNDLAALRFLSHSVDSATQTASADFLGLFRHRAQFRPNLGCTLLLGPIASPASRRLRAPAPATVPRNDLAWPAGDAAVATPLPSDVDEGRLNSAIDWAFSEPDSHVLRRTRAVVVVHGGRIVAERYASGFSKDSRFAGWSMSKSVLNALVGILVAEGKLSLDMPAPVREWQAANDPRRTITPDHLLRMSSGLEFNEDAGDLRSDVIRMMRATSDMAHYAATKPLSSAPGSKWQYSSGTTNILSGVIRRAIGDDQRYLELPRRALFDRIGMSSAMIAIDEAGTFVGSSGVFATARDWARFGLLYLRDGTWLDERILPKGWVDYTRTPAPANTLKMYGAHFWLRLPSASLERPVEKDLPPGSFSAVGHEGQYVTVVPSRDLVVVRLGLSRDFMSFSQADFVDRVLEAMQ